MSDRASVWRYLLPSGAVEPTAAGAPAGLHAAADTLVTSGAARAGLPELAQYRSVVWFKAPRGAAAELDRRGFGHTRCFTAVPSLRRARWYLPVAPPRAVRGAWGLYSPTTTAGRLARAVARLVGSLGGGSLLGECLLLASREPSGLEQSLSVLLGRPFHMSISLPHEKGQRDRLWLLLLDGGGRALAFAKFAYQPESVDRLTREVRFTRFASALDLRTCVVPGVLCAQAVDNGLLMVCSPLPGDARESSSTLTARHLAALEELAGHPGAVASTPLVEQLRDRCEHLSHTLPRAWAERLSRALDVVEACPGLGDLPTVLSHGDFVPWNLRKRRDDGRLIVFDWEQAQESQFVLWDAFNFLAQVDIVLRRPLPAASVHRALELMRSSPLALAFRLTPTQVAALQLAYLADASARWFESHRPYSTWEFEMGRTRTQPMRAGMIDAALGVAGDRRG